MRVSVIIPTFNERGTIKELLRRIFVLGISGLEVIVVDDSSSDGTLEVLRSLKRRYPVTVILRPRKLGLGSALKDGLALAKTRGAQVAITMDADLSHDPAVIPKMLERMQQAGTDLAVGSRRIAGGEIAGWGPARHAMSRAAMAMARAILGLTVRDVTSGFRAYRRRVLETVDFARAQSTGYAFQEEMIFRTQRAGFKIEEIPIVFQDRTHGKSKLGIKDIMEFFITVLRLRFYA